jgi:hypothetical protein
MLIDSDDDDDADTASNEEFLAAATAAATGNLEALKVAHPAARFIGSMPLLHIAAEGGFALACNFLVNERKFGVDDMSADGGTALHVACGRFGNDEVVAEVYTKQTVYFMNIHCVYSCSYINAFQLFGL